MSGVYIPSMNMPDECQDCPFYVPPYQFYESPSWCHVLGKTKDDEEKCPLVEVKDHGRLIDADALLQRFYKEQTACEEHGRDFSFSFKSGNELCTEWWSVECFVEDAETVIPPSLDGAT